MDYCFDRENEGTDCRVKVTVRISVIDGLAAQITFMGNAMCSD